MRVEIFALMALVGACVWALRVLPMQFSLSRLPEGGALARFFAATGVAAIATLFAASILPEFSVGRAWPALVGSLAVLAVYLPSRSVVMATVAGAAAYGAVFAVLA
jgi:branched-subunit amino acid transport protein